MVQEKVYLKHLIGSKVFLDSVSPFCNHGVVFEDDGDVGYFYALDIAGTEQQIRDTLHIYDVQFKGNQNRLVLIQIVWSPDGLKAGLLLDGQYQAVFDFVSRRGYGRSRFSPNTGEWSKDGHGWDERVADFFE